MTMVSMKSIGLCANYSEAGDWAFDFALGLARKHNLQLNIFHFLADPFDPSADSPMAMPKDQRDAMSIEMERNLRFYYDERLGDHLKAGFRVCESNEWTELHHCLMRREFELLVLPYPKRNATFGGKPIEDFAKNFVSPVALVGPDTPDQIRLNNQAGLANKIADFVGAQEILATALALIMMAGSI